MPFEVQGKVAIITGGASGLGFLFAKVLLQRGLKNVTLADINVTAGQVAIKELCDKYGSGKASFVQADVAKPEQFEEVFTETLKRYKNIDMVINNAGILDRSDWESVIDINLKGIIRGTLLGLDYVSKYKSGENGLILNISSIAGLDVFPGVPFYSATKSGALMFSRCLGDKEHYKRTHVQIVTICPGMTDTPLLLEGLKRLYSPEFTELVQKQLENNGRYQVQAATHVSDSLLEVVKQADTGSVWVIENGEKPFELEFPERWGEKKNT